MDDRSTKRRRKLLADHTTLELECIDRMYVYVPMLQTGASARPRGTDPRYNRRRDSVAAVDHKHSRIKQYHEEGRALRTETVVNDTPVRRTDNDHPMTADGYATSRTSSPSASPPNRRLLRVQRFSHDCAIGAGNVRQFPAATLGRRPARVCPALRRPPGAGPARRAARLPGAARRVPEPEPARPIFGVFLAAYNRNRMIYDLRRLRLEGGDVFP